MTGDYERHSAAMTAAEFRIARESLGVTTDWLAADLSVALRTVRRWEHAATPIPTGVSDRIIDLMQQRDDFVDAVVAALDADPHPDGEWITTYASDATYRLHHPDADWPAGWHRAAMGRVAERRKGVRISYTGDAE